MEYKLFTDGGARGNPGNAGIGAVIFDNHDVIDFDAKFYENLTNNQAEYLALLLGIKMALKNKIHTLICFLDSELVVKQINGEYKIKDLTLQKIKSKIDIEIKKFDRIEFCHVRREKNKFADRLVNLAMDIKNES